MSAHKREDFYEMLRIMALRSYFQTRRLAEQGLKAKMMIGTLGQVTPLPFVDFRSGCSDPPPTKGLAST